MTVDVVDAPGDSIVAGAVAVVLPVTVVVLGGVVVYDIQNDG